MSGTNGIDGQQIMALLSDIMTVLRRMERDAQEARRRLDGHDPDFEGLRENDRRLEGGIYSHAFHITEFGARLDRIETRLGLPPLEPTK